MCSPAAVRLEWLSVARARLSLQSLAAYLLSQEQDLVDRFVGSLSFGGGCVNPVNLHSWIESLPFGGVGASGMGKYHGKAGFATLSNNKVMRTADGYAELDVFPPYAGRAPAVPFRPFR